MTMDSPQKTGSSQGVVTKVAAKEDPRSKQMVYRATIRQSNGLRTNGPISRDLVDYAVDAGPPDWDEFALVTRAFKNLKVKVTGSFTPTPDDPTFFWWDSKSRMEILP